MRPPQRRREHINFGEIPVYLVHICAIVFRSCYNARMFFGELTLGNWLSSLNPARAIFKLLKVELPENVHSNEDNPYT